MPVLKGGPNFHLPSSKWGQTTSKYPKTGCKVIVFKRCFYTASTKAGHVKWALLNKRGIFLLLLSVGHVKSTPFSMTIFFRRFWTSFPMNWPFKYFGTLWRILEASQVWPAVVVKVLFTIVSLVKNYVLLLRTSTTSIFFLTASVYFLIEPKRGIYVWFSFLRAYKETALFKLSRALGVLPHDNKIGRKIVHPDIRFCQGFQERRRPIRPATTSRVPISFKGQSVITQKRTAKQNFQSSCHKRVVFVHH